MSASPDVKIKINAWRRQHAALGAPAYRLTLRGRREGQPKGWNLGKSKGEGGSERFWTASEVEDQILTLRQYNTRGFDVYITPIDSDHWYLVLDDSNPDRLAALCRERGWTPALVQETSKHDDGRSNIQAIFIATRRPGDREAANAVVAEINREYGDPVFTGAIHPFRVAAFSNKKPGKDSLFTRIIGASAITAPDLALDRLIRGRVEACRDVHPCADARPTTGGAAPMPMPVLLPSIRESNAEARWMHYAAEVVYMTVEVKCRRIDFSRIDFLVAADMIREGWSDRDVEAALLACSDQIRAAHGGRPIHEKHGTVHRYAVSRVQDARRFVSAPRAAPAPVRFNPAIRPCAFTDTQDPVTAAPKKPRGPGPE